MTAIDVATRKIVKEAVDSLHSETIDLLQRLVRIPSENHPPNGDEYAVQCAYRDHLQQLGLVVDFFDPMDVPAFLEHPARLHEHEMRGRPNVVGTLPGAGGGRSMLLIAHADVETPGVDSLWQHGTPFSGICENGRIYGRGAGDDKSGMANNAMVARVLQECGITLHGDLQIAAVADEERGGSNGITALLAKGYHADACLNADGVHQNIAVSNLGGGYCRLELSVPSPVDDGTQLLDYFEDVKQQILAFRQVRGLKMTEHPHYAAPPHTTHPVKIIDVKLAVEDYTYGTLDVWFYLLPGESPEDFQRQFTQAVGQSAGSGTCKLNWQSRLIPPSEIAENHPFTSCICHAFQEATGRPPRVTGNPMSDMGFVNHYGGIPCISHGISRWDEEGMAHQPNEYVEAAKVKEYLITTVFCVLEWCGYTRK